MMGGSAACMWPARGPQLRRWPLPTAPPTQAAHPATTCVAHCPRSPLRPRAAPAALARPHISPRHRPPPPQWGGRHSPRRTPPLLHAGVEAGGAAAEQLLDRETSLDREMLFIAVPTLFSLAVDPLASLVDTAFIGRIGAVELGAAAVAMSVTTFAFKLLSMPLLFITTSAVAKATMAGDDGQQLRSATRAVLGLAAIIGALQLGALGAGCGTVLGWMGVGAGDAMRGHAASYLTWRALGMPASMLLLTAQGVWRGLGDTRPPLVATVICTVVNIALDWLFIFPLGMGVKGAAIATVLGQCAASAWLLATLERRHPFARAPAAPAAAGAVPAIRVSHLLGRVALLSARTLGPFSLFTLAAATAARGGAEVVAAHQVAFQLWLAVGLLADSVAVAAQTILAKQVAAGRAARARGVVARSLLYGLGMGVAAGAMLAAAGGALPAVFTTDAGVLSRVVPLMAAVAASQPIVAGAFVGDGLLFGVEDFGFATAMMLASAGLGIAVLGASCWGLPPGDPRCLGGVWAGMETLMAGRMVFSCARCLLFAGPFAALRPEGGGGAPLAAKAE